MLPNVNIRAFSFILKIFFTFFTKQATLTRRSNILSLPLQLVLLLSTVALGIMILSIRLTNVVMSSVVMLNVVAPPELALADFFRIGLKKMVSWCYAFSAA